MPSLLGNLDASDLVRQVNELENSLLANSYRQLDNSLLANTIPVKMITVTNINLIPKQ